MKKRLIFTLGLIAFILGFLTLQSGQHETDNQKAGQEANVEVPTPGAIGETDIHSVDEPTKENQSAHKARRKGLRKDSDPSASSRRYRGYDNSLDDEVMNMMEEGQVSMADESASTLQGEIFEESTDLQIQ